jgi:diguanylate cyclase (GGDEF)-like protein
MIRGRRGSWYRAWLSLLVLVAFGCVAAVAARAETLVNLQPDQHLVDLTEHGTRVAAQRRNLQLEVPGESDNSRAVLELRGEGPGPEFSWTIFTFRNAGPEKRAFILAIDAQRLAASGIVNLQPFGSQLVSDQWLSKSVEFSQQISATGDAFRFELNPAQSITVGLEGRAVLIGARIYDVQSFAQREASLAFLRGAALAVAFVLSLSIFALYGIRANRAFLVGGFFGLCCLLMMALEAGYFGPSAFKIGELAVTMQEVRAVVESLVAFGCGLLLWGLTSLKKRGFKGDLPFMLLLLGLAALVGISFYDPNYSTKAARWAVTILVISGFIASIRARRNAAEVMDNATLFWSTLVLWVFLGAVAIGGESLSPLWHAITLAGLTTVLGVLAFACLRLAFAQGFLSKPYLTDSSRRSLALTGADHFLWDWQPQENALEVGVELARSLGSKEKLNPMMASRWFAALIHPSDEMAYRSCLDLRQLKAGDFVEQELRLRDTAGEYHWFALRARALPGPRGIPARLIGTLTDITRNKQTEDKLITESIHDPVTGLPTRALFMDRLEREVSKPISHPHRVLMIGIERFKILNEGLGHELGDQLLMAAGQRIAECLKNSESVARISGSRFAVMHVENIDGRSAEALADEIIQKLAEPINVLSQEVYLSACIGISLKSSPRGNSSELQQQAETALHEAQSHGPRSVVTFHEKIEDERADNVALETDLRRAIMRNEIEVHYQPIVNLVTRDIVGLEALARWRHPVRGLLQPADFIGMAEQAGLIREVGDIVLIEAIRQIGIWQRVLTRNKPIYMAVNVSADQLSDIRFLDRLNAMLAREGALPYSIKIEITESVVMRYPERARQLIQRLRGVGIGVACDDFGTGFSNLSSLRELAFDTLKIDRSFLASNGLEGRGSVILQSVINMAHSLGMAVVAEGVETEDQAIQLVQLGCELGQGFALGHPITAREVHQLLAVLPVVPQEEVEPEPETEAEPEFEHVPAPTPVAKPRSVPRPALTPTSRSTPLTELVQRMALPEEEEEFDEEFDEDFEEDEFEPEELPSIFSLPAGHKPEPKPVAQRPKPVTNAKPKPKAKPKAKVMAKKPSTPKKKKSSRRR